ncbi:MAG TPA: hypothetical protein VF786_04010, partial [Terriglobales bacterium]
IGLVFNLGVAGRENVLKLLLSGSLGIDFFLAPVVIVSAVSVYSRFPWPLPRSNCNRSYS